MEQAKLKFLIRELQQEAQIIQHAIDALERLYFSRGYRDVPETFPKPKPAPVKAGLPGRSPVQQETTVDSLPASASLALAESASNST